jgi:hypothetical protein
MKNILLIIVVSTLVGCGLLPPTSPIMSRVVQVSREESGKTITLHQEIIRPSESGVSVHLPAGTYKHTATGTGYFYFRSPKHIAYLHPQREKSLSSTGGIAISKTMLQPCYIYMDEDPEKSPGTKMWTWMLGMEFINEEGKVWWKRNY